MVMVFARADTQEKRFPAQEKPFPVLDFAFPTREMRFLDQDFTFPAREKRFPVRDFAFPNRKSDFLCGISLFHTGKAISSSPPMIAKQQDRARRSFAERRERFRLSDDSLLYSLSGEIP